MKHACLVLALLFAASAQEGGGVRLPSGKMQRDEILKADYEKSLQDSAELVKLSEEVKAELERNERHVLSIGIMKKTEEIEKLARRIRQRMKRF